MPKGVPSTPEIRKRRQERLLATLASRTEEELAQHQVNVKAGRAKRSARGPSAEPAWKGMEVGYYTIHIRVRKELKADPCSLADDTCKGQLEVAFLHEAPKEFVREEEGRPYYFGPVIRDGYWKLCRSHHLRYDRERRWG